MITYKHCKLAVMPIPIDSSGNVTRFKMPKKSSRARKKKKDTSFIGGLYTGDRVQGQWAGQENHMA